MPDASPRPPFPAWVVAPLAVALALAQVGVAVLASGRPDPLAGWRSLYRFDGDWFASVAATGYHFPAEPTKDDPGNVAFFPAYPLLAWAVKGCGLATADALLVVAQLAAVGVWAYLLLLLRQFRVSAGNAAVVLALFAAHPALFFLVASYSESTFILALLGFVYWCRRAGWAAAGVAAAHGLLLTGSRVLGLPLVVLPLLLAATGAAPRGWWRATAVAAAAAAGGLAYLAYLQIAFGRWDAFAVAHRVGWDVFPDPLGFFRLKTWDYKLAELGSSVHDPAALARTVFPLTVLQFVLLAVLEGLAARRGGGGWRVRVPLLLAAAALFAVPVLTHHARGVFGLFRFALPYHAVLAVVAGSALTDGPAWVRAWWARLLAAPVVVWSAAAQWGMTRLYLASEFVG